ncbi:MAG: hypothetical protein DRI57_05870 [Deltaproteobacteria bacterium]|nr:MAG: hypothetical protein DRI57_05870 [Deltaproteobacteria bacterium]
MASPFSRTMRSLKTDSFRASLIGMTVALILLSAWSAWFFMAKVTLYKISRKAYVKADETVVAAFPRKDSRRARETRQNRVVAEFSSKMMGNIRSGQRAMLYLDGDIGKKTGPILAIVKNVNTRQGKGKGVVELLTLTDADSPLRIRHGLSGQVKIETDYVSPAVLVMRASGLFADTPALSVSPQ